MMKRKKNNPSEQDRSQQAWPLNRRAAYRQTGVLVLLVSAVLAFGCDSSDGDAPQPLEESDIWDEMNWDEGSWALYHGSTLGKIG